MPLAAACARQRVTETAEDGVGALAGFLMAEGSPEAVLSTGIAHRIAQLASGGSKNALRALVLLCASEEKKSVQAVAAAGALSAAGAIVNAFCDKEDGGDRGDIEERVTLACQVVCGIAEGGGVGSACLVAGNGGGAIESIVNMLKEGKGSRGLRKEGLWAVSRAVRRCGNEGEGMKCKVSMLDMGVVKELGRGLNRGCEAEGDKELRLAILEALWSFLLSGEMIEGPEGNPITRELEEIGTLDRIRDMAVDDIDSEIAQFCDKIIGRFTEGDELNDDDDDDNDYNEDDDDNDENDDMGGMKDDDIDIDDDDDGNVVCVPDM